MRAPATLRTTGPTPPRHASSRATRPASRYARASSATWSGPARAADSTARRRRMSSATGEPRPRLALLGGDGFIGSRVVRAAVAAGAEVTAICARPPWRLDELELGPVRIVRVPEGRWWEAPGQAAIAAALADADAFALPAYEAPERRQGPMALE